MSSLNDNAIEFRSTNNVLISCPRADLGEPVTVFAPAAEQNTSQALMEFGIWWWRNFYNELHWFNGYDTVQFRFEEEA